MPGLAGSNAGINSTTEASALLEMLPTEIRLMIFERVLAFEGSVMKQIDESQDGAINTALLSISRRVSLEARDAFLNVNTIRIVDQFNMPAPLADIHHVELTGDLAAEFFEGTATDFQASLERLSLLPRLKILTLDVGGVLRTWWTLRVLIDSLTTDPNVEVSCVSIGLCKIKLSNKSSTRIYLRSSKLIATLPRAQVHARDYSLESLFQKYIWYSSHGEDGWADPRDSPLEIMLAWFLSCYEATRKARTAAHTFTPGNRTDLVVRNLKFMIAYFGTGEGAPSTREFLPDDVRLEEVSLKGQGPEALEWASEVLCFYFAVLEVQISRYPEENE